MCCSITTVSGCDFITFEHEYLKFCGKNIYNKLCFMIWRVFIVNIYFPHYLTTLCSKITTKLCKIRKYVIRNINTKLTFFCTFFNCLLIITWRYNLNVLSFKNRFINWNVSDFSGIFQDKNHFFTKNVFRTHYTVNDYSSLSFFVVT